MADLRDETEDLLMNLLQEEAIEKRFEINLLLLRFLFYRVLRRRTGNIFIGLSNLTNR